MNQVFSRNITSLVGLFLGVFLFGMIAEAWAGPPLGRGWRHHLRSQKGHHGQGFAGDGFCPQMRVTARAPDDIRNQPNPLDASPEVLYSGETLFQVDVQPVACKICHGVNGNGLGIMAQGLNPSPRNFNCKETMKEISDGQLFWIIRNGSPGTGMPAYKSLKDREIWQIVHYLRKLTQARRR
jgi:mono/diheme cytochrome c family protein